jgi:hypothetical protein
MASTYSLRFRLNFQAPGDNLNLWGTILNVGVFQLLEDAIAKRLAFTLSGAKTLTSALGASDEARSAFLDITGGTGGTITIPSVEKIYLVNNSATGNVVVTTGAGVVATVQPGEMNFVVCDAANVRMLGVNGLSLKDYVTSVAFSASGALPAQAGNAGKFVKTDGANATWQFPASTDLSDYATNVKGLQVALAVAFSN